MEDKCENQTQESFLDTLNVYVSGLPLDFDDSALRGLFSEFGDIVSAKVMVDNATGRAKGIGFVLFTSEESARKALVVDQRVIGNRTIRVRYAERTAQYQSATASTKLFIRNVPPNVTESQLSEYFAKFGGVQTCRFGVGANQQAVRTAYIRMDTLEAAQNAVRANHDDFPYKHVANRCGISVQYDVKPHGKSKHGSGESADLRTHTLNPSPMNQAEMPKLPNVTVIPPFASMNPFSALTPMMIQPLVIPSAPTSGSRLSVPGPQLIMPSPFHMYPVGMDSSNMGASSRSSLSMSSLGASLNSMSLGASVNSMRGSVSGALPGATVFQSVNASGQPLIFMVPQQQDPSAHQFTFH